MTRLFANSLLMLLLLCLAAPAAMAQSIEIRLPDGSRWRGDIEDRVEVRFMQRGTEITVTGNIIREGDLYIVVESDLAGDRRQWTIIKSDLRAMRTVSAGEQQPAPRRGTRPDRAPQQEQTPDSEPATQDNAETPGVFVLPLSGMVGPRIHHGLIEDMVKEADKYGEGQIIILQLTTGGGAVIEMEQIARVILDAKRRHRFVAWVHEAISAGCATAILCDEIYFTTEGTAGSMTMFAGTQAAKGEELRRWLEVAGEWAEAGGRSRYIPQAMIHAPLMLSYDKDPVTGEVTFYNDLSGQYILSRPGDNLTFNSTNAVHCGFAGGIADTTDELAELLDLPRWREISDYGRRIHAEWNALVDRAEDEIPRIIVRMSRGTVGDARANLNFRIQRVREMISWWDRAAVAMRFIDGWGGSKEFWEAQLRELLHQQRNLR